MVRVSLRVRIRDRVNVVMCKSRLAPILRYSNFSLILNFNVPFASLLIYIVVFSLIQIKIVHNSPYFWTMESPYFWLHRVGSPANGMPCTMAYLSMDAGKLNLHSCAIHQNTKKMLYLKRVFF